MGAGGPAVTAVTILPLVSQSVNSRVAAHIPVQNPRRVQFLEAGRLAVELGHAHRSRVDLLEVAIDRDGVRLRDGALERTKTALVHKCQVRAE